MTLLRLLNVQGIAGIGVSIALALLLILQKGETRLWKKQSGQFEQLYHDQRTALAGTVANYRAAAAQAQLADKANAERVAAAQRTINERTKDEFEVRLAAARADARRLRAQAPAAAADPDIRPGAAMPGLPAPAVRANEASRQDGLSGSDALTATEQAIQLDELIKWVRAQHAVQIDAPR